ncbi:MAG: hypothetical protein AAFQ94_30135 [Bacteroidota bacterium]
MAIENDQILNDFFNEMKRNDQSKAVPEVDYLKISRKRRRKRRNLIGIAASFVLLVGSYWIWSQSVDQKPEKSLSEIEQNIESMMSWQSATSDLIE